MQHSDRALPWGYAALAKGNYRLTATRKAILAVLARNGSHLTPSQIMQEARKLHVRINLASVYRNLGLFTDLGLVRPLFLGATQPHYIRNDQPHHHAVCLQCYEVVDFEDCVAAELETRLRERYGFQCQSHLLEFYGLCQACQAPARPSEQ